MTGTAATPLNALLAPLGFYGGPTQTMPPLPGSPAIAAGSTSLIPNGVTTDQRGKGRTLNGTVDIGAVETQGYTLTRTGGNSQTALGGAAFASPLSVSVTANDVNDPVNGGVISFAGPATGASATFSPAKATIVGGAASSTATANATPGSYNATASASGANTVAFALRNIVQPAFSGLTSATSTYGTASATFTGSLAAGTSAATGSVTVTISGNGITALSTSASLDATGHFSATINTAALPANPTSPYTVTYAYTAQGNFLAASDQSTTLTVNQAGLTVTAASPTILIGQSVPSLTYTYTGLVNGDASASFTGGLATTATGTPAAGTYAVTQGTLAATGNYKITNFVAGTLTVVGSGVSVVGNALYLVGGNTNDQVKVSAIGSSQTGGTGVRVTGKLNNVSINRTFTQAFATIFVVGYNGNDSIEFADSLTVAAVITEGNGNDQIKLGNGNNKITAGTGNLEIKAGNGTNTINAGAAGSSGNIQVELGNGANNLVTLLGNGNDQVQAGDGDGNVVTIIGNGNNQIELGNGNGNVASITGNGNNQIQLGDGNGCSVTMVGNGNNQIETGNGSGTVHVAGTGKKKVKLGGNGWRLV
ncbi:MAG: choice-of-anchor Q domain-containing protein [Isosphaeraceae bacterium]